MPRKKTPTPGIDVDGRIILKLIYKKYDGDVVCIDMAQDRGR
jgi:hypothetical protein